MFKERKEIRKRLNNKGFSLVELIVVIAIMAILIGVVGTQVLPYIEKSRAGKDEQVLSALLTDAVSSYAMTATEVAAGNTKLTCTAGANTASEIVAGGGTSAKLAEQILELRGLAAGDFIFKKLHDKFESKVYKAADSIEISQDATGVVTVQLLKGSTEVKKITSK